MIKQNFKPHIDKKTYNSLITGGDSTGKLYGTCKVHKKDYSLRPIISMLNTPLYKLAKYLDITIETKCSKS